MIDVSDFSAFDQCIQISAYARTGFGYGICRVSVKAMREKDMDFTHRDVALFGIK